MTPEGIRSRAIERDSGCWEWQRAIDRRGYGVTTIKGKSWFAHRLSYTLSVGEIPDGMFVCHRCDNPLCVNPAHLFLGTPADNVNDAIAKRRFSAFPSKLSSGDRAEIVRLFKSGVSQCEIARRYAIRQYTVSYHLRRAGIDARPL